MLMRRKSIQVIYWAKSQGRGHRRNITNCKPDDDTHCTKQVGSAGIWDYEMLVAERSDPV